MQSLILHPKRLIIALATVMLLCMPNMLKAELILGTFEDPKDTDGKLIEGWYFSNGGEYGGAKGGMKLDDMDSHNGDGCLALTADFSGGGKYVAVRKRLNLSKSEKPEKITFYIKNQSLNYLLVRVIDETGQTFQHRINVKQAVSWQKIELDKMVTKPNWGGAKDGKWHGLIYEFGILIEKQAITDGKEAQLQIDDVYINGEAPSDVSAKADTPVSTKQAKQITKAPSKLPLPLGEFEDGTVSGWWVHRDGSAPAPYASSSNPHTGKGCMAVPIDFGDRDWMSLIRQIDQPVSVRELAFFARSENLNGISVIIHTATGQRYQKDIKLNTNGDWQTIQLNDLPNDNPSLGSSNTQMYDAQMMLKIAINQGDKTNANKPATLWLDDVSVGVDAKEGMVNLPGAVFVSQGPLSACLQLQRTIPVYFGQSEKPDHVIFTLKNDGSQSVESPQVLLLDHQLRPVKTLAKQGQFSVAPKSTVQHTLNVDLPQYGHYSIVTQVGDRQAQAKLAWMAETAQPDSKSEFGVQTHFSHGPWGRTQYFGGAEGVLKMAANLGAGWVRDDAHARFRGETMIEPEKNLWSFTDNAVKFGLSPMISHFDFLDDGKAPDDDASRQRFANRAVQVLDHYGKDVKVYEVWNEPTIQPGWKRTPDAVEYTKLLKTVYTTIKKHHPETTVLGVCSAGTDFGFIETVLKNGGGKFMDGISVHPYHGVAPELAANRHEPAPTWMGSGDTITFEKRIAAIKVLLEKYGVGDLPIWGTEMGYNNKDAREDWKQTQWLIRQYLIGMSIPYLTRQFNYNFNDQGYNSPDSTKMTFGMFQGNGMPEPNAVAYNTMSRMLHGKKFDRKIDLGKDIFAYRYVNRDNDADPALAIWCVDDGMTLGLKTSRSSITSTDLMGNQTIIHPINGTFTMAVTGEVTFLADPGQLTVTEPQIQITAPERCTSEEPLHATVSFANGFNPDHVHALAPQLWLDAQVENNKLKFTPAPTLTTGRYIMTVKADGMSAATAVDLANSIFLTTTLTAKGVDVTINNPFPYDRKMRLRVAAGDQRMQERPTLFASQSQSFSFPVQSQMEKGWVCQPVRINPQLRDGRRGYIQMTEGSSDSMLAGQTPLYAIKQVRIDGDVREWQTYQPCILDGKDLAVKLGKNQSWEGSEDLSARFYVGDDGENLLLAITVTDNHFTQGAPVNLMWQGDSVQFAIATSDQAKERHEYTLGVDANGMLQVYEQSPVKRSITQQVKTAVQTNGNQRVMELAIPWAMLAISNPQTQPIRFALLVNDNDAKDMDKDNLLRNRKSFLQWFQGIGGARKEPSKYSFFVRQ